MPHCKYLSIYAVNFPAQLFRYFLETGVADSARPLCSLAQDMGNRLFASTATRGIGRRFHRLNLALCGMVASEMSEHKNSLTDYRTWVDSLSTLQVDNPDYHYELGYAYCEQGTALCNLDLYEEAASSLHASIRIFESIKEFRPEWLTAPMTTLGLIYCEQSKLVTAKTVLQEALQEQEKAFGKDDSHSYRQVSHHQYEIDRLII